MRNRRATGPTLTISDLRRGGYRIVRFCCTSKTCAQVIEISLDELMSNMVDPKGTLLSLAKAARCRSCGGKGAHIEPVQLGPIPRNT